MQCTVHSDILQYCLSDIFYMKATTKTKKNWRSLWTAPGVMTRAGRHDSIVADLYVWKVRCDITLTPAQCSACSTRYTEPLQFSSFSS